MRLNEDQRKAILDEATLIFGKEATLRLFGSRIDDHARGGDIDLHVEASGTPAELLDRELRFRARLLRRLGDRRIDIVVHERNQPLRLIDQQALQTGIPL